MRLNYFEEHLTEQELFALVRFWKLITGKENTNLGELFTFRDLILGEQDALHIHILISDLWEISKVKAVVPLEDYSFDYSPHKELVAARKTILKSSSKDSRKFLRILDKIENTQTISRNEISKIMPYWNNVNNYLLFDQKKLASNLDGIREIELLISKYLQDYTEDELLLAGQNFLRFEKQKVFFIDLIKADNKVDKYGKRFILEQKVNKYGQMPDQTDVCVLHTAYALENLNLLIVNNAWYERYPQKYGKLSIDVSLSEKFIEEIKHPENLVNNDYIQNFDPKTGILEFSGKQIELSKKGKETDAVLLMGTLLKREDDEWVHNDQILEDWGITEDDILTVPNHKIYHTGLRINLAVQLKTNIKDLIEVNTTKARINPKYRNFTNNL